MECEDIFSARVNPAQPEQDETEKRDRESNQHLFMLN